MKFFGGKKNRLSRREGFGKGGAWKAADGGGLGEGGSGTHHVQHMFLAIGSKRENAHHPVTHNKHARTRIALTKYDLAFLKFQ